MRTEDAHPNFIHAFHAYSPKGWTYRRGGGGEGQSMCSPSFIHAFHANSLKGRIARVGGDGQSMHIPASSTPSMLTHLKVE